MKKLENFNYYITESGTLQLYNGNCIICEISDCGNMSKKALNNLIDEVLEQLEYEIK